MSVGQAVVCLSRGRRIKTEEKEKVVASVWGEELIKFLAALAFCTRKIWRIGWIHPFISNQPGAIHPIFQNHPRRFAELKLFFDFQGLFLYFILNQGCPRIAYITRNKHPTGSVIIFIISFFILSFIIRSFFIIQRL